MSSLKSSHQNNEQTLGDLAHTNYLENVQDSASNKFKTGIGENLPMQKKVISRMNILSIAVTNNNGHTQLLTSRTISDCKVLHGY
jgi:hypothetical protein